MATRVPSGPGPAARRARLAVVVLFVTAGAVMGGWAGRIPSVKERVGLGDGAWGLLVLAVPIGSLLVLLVLPRVITRTGARRLALPGATLLLVTAPVAALAQHPLALAGALLVQGLAIGLLFGPMKALAVRVERAYDRSIMSSFHAFFSLGQLAGGLAGVLAGGLAVTPAQQLVASDLVLAVLFVATLRFLPRDHPAPGSVPRPARRARRTSATALTPQLLLLATMALLTSANEGAAAQWSAQYAVSLGGSVAIGSLTLVCYSVSIALARAGGDAVVDRLGQRRFLMVSGAVSAAGLLVCTVGGTVPAALAGFALLGVGSGCVIPTVVGLAGNQPDVDPGRGVALVSLGEWPAFLLGPPVIGLLSELVDLRFALGLLVVSATALVLLAGRVRPVVPGVSGGRPAPG